MTLTQESTQASVQTRRWNIHYHEAGSGHPVILLHGSGAGATGWSNFSNNIGPLAEHFRVFAVDMPGWGKSDPVTYDERDHPGALLDFMDALGLEKATLVGNSMGGITTFDVAVNHPERVSHAITMGTAHMRNRMLFGAGDGPTEGLKILFRGYRDPTPENMRELVSVMCFDKSFATEELGKLRAEAAVAVPQHLTNFVEGLAKGSPVPKWYDLDKLDTMQVPTLLIHGRDDRVVHYEQSLHFVARIPNSRLVLLNRCGHWAMIEHAAEFNRLAIDFVTNN